MDDPPYPTNPEKLEKFKEPILNKISDALRRDYERNGCILEPEKLIEISEFLATYWHMMDKKWSGEWVWNYFREMDKKTEVARKKLKNDIHQAKRIHLQLSRQGQVWRDYVGSADGAIRIQY